MDNRPIGIFDSGVGGLTVFKEIRDLLPSENLVYFGDTARVPYGGKSVQVIQRFSSEIANFLEMQNVKMIVVACNTASALALHKLKTETSLPVIGVIDPGVRAAIKAAGNGVIGVIGTRATINSGAYQERVTRLRNGVRVVARACPLLVPIVEENLMNSEIARLTLEMYLGDFKKMGISSLILACTHYPLLKTMISDFFADRVTLVDSACETAREVKEMLVARRISIEDVRHGHEQFFVTDSPEGFAAIAEEFLGRPLAGECIQHSWQTE
ncbi:MAG TPA: glutamate racemase [Candidatus Rifleibacterium sp.]|nr:glutamate racemase [Candidatus Rifleibacterium sp.]HPT47320.1 glutamate racemase [Candidatus Rifleibacterium sp.]